MTSIWEVFGMPDKQNENKFMAMLERRGIVRKADVEDEPEQPVPSEARVKPEADLRALFGSPPGGEITNVTPAARQPVPGISTPVFPSERPQVPEREEPRPVERVVPLQTAPIMKSEPELPDPVRPEPPRPEPARPEPPRPEPPRPEPPRPEPVRPEPVRPEPEERELSRPVERELPRPVDRFIPEPQIVSVDPFREIIPRDEDLDSEPVAAPEFVPPQPPPVENYTERYLEIDELYNALALKSKRTDTIYLVEEYLRTLPDSLPEESRREIVGKIVTASGFDYDLLMGDGVLRVKMLKEYAERFARHTDDYVSARQAELDELDQQILRIRRLIENRRELHKRQFFAIEAEAQRLKEILTFISG